ncbi:unnamed protein product [Arabidopsis halleri]
MFFFSVYFWLIEKISWLTEIHLLIFSAWQCFIYFYNFNCILILIQIIIYMCII